jgi:hypothetical protein
MKNHKAQKDILYISISSFVLTVLWIGFNLYHAHVASTIEPSLQLQIEPIEPSFDTETIGRLKNRQSVAPLFELEGSSISTPEANTTPSPETEEPPVSTESEIQTESVVIIETPGE